MKTVPLTDAKARLSELVEQVASRDERVTITRNGRPAAVLVSPDELESWQETLEIMKDARLMASIRRGLEDLRRGRVYTLTQLDATLAKDEASKSKRLRSSGR